MCVETMKPRNEVSDKTWRKVAFVVAPSADVMAVIVSEPLVYSWSNAAPISVFGADQDPIDLCIVLNVVRVRYTAFIAMMGIELQPLLVIVFEIDVVAKSVLQAPS